MIWKVGINKSNRKLSTGWSQIYLPSTEFEAWHSCWFEAAASEAVDGEAVTAISKLAGNAVHNLMNYCKILRNSWIKSVGVQLVLRNI